MASRTRIIFYFWGEKDMKLKATQMQFWHEVNFCRFGSFSDLNIKGETQESERDFMVSRQIGFLRLFTAIKQ